MLQAFLVSSARVEEAPRRTCSSIRKHAQAFRKDGFPWKNAQNDFRSYEPLLSGDDSAEIVDAPAVSELHLVLGITDMSLHELNAA